MNKYEGLFILESSVKDEALKLAIDKIQDAIKHAGGRVTNVQKMDQRSFARSTSKRQSGYYVNFNFDAPATAIAELNTKFRLDTSLVRFQFTRFVPVTLPVRKRVEGAETFMTRDRDSSGGRDRDYGNRDRD